MTFVFEPGGPGFEPWWGGRRYVTVRRYMNVRPKKAPTRLFWKLLPEELYFLSAKTSDDPILFSRGSTQFFEIYKSKQ